MSNFQTYSKYYDLLYKEKNYRAESEYIIKIISDNNIDLTDILELGSGTGSHASIFSENNIKVTGIELSEAMVDIAKSKKIKDYEPLVGNIVNYNLSKQFGVAIALFHVISYLTDNNSLIGCFRNTHNHLKQGGIFVFDVWYSPAVYNQKPEPRIKRLEDNSIEIIRFAEPIINYNENKVIVSYDIIIRDKQEGSTENFKELHPMRHFSIPEIEMLADLTGFELIKAEEFLTKTIPSESTWGVCFVLKKK